MLFQIVLIQVYCIFISGLQDRFLRVQILLEKIRIYITAHSGDPQPVAILVSYTKSLIHEIYCHYY